MIVVNSRLVLVRLENEPVSSATETSSTIATNTHRTGTTDVVEMFVVSSKKSDADECNCFDCFRSSTNLDSETIFAERGYFLEQVIHETEIVFSFCDTQNVFNSILRLEPTRTQLIV